MTDMQRTVSEIGEAGLIHRISAVLPKPDAGEAWIGDDAAVLSWDSGRLLFSVDALVEGVDFDLAYCDGSDVGWKAVASNVSDIAAMGGRPRYALGTLVVPVETDLGVVDDIFRAMSDAARGWGLSLVGGDISRGDQISVSVAIVGEPLGEPVYRSGAAAGEAICVTGSLGGAAGGLLALRHGLLDRASGHDRAAVERLIQRPLR